MVRNSGLLERGLKRGWGTLEGGWDQAGATYIVLFLASARVTLRLGGLAGLVNVARWKVLRHPLIHRWMSWS